MEQLGLRELWDAATPLVRQDALGDLAITCIESWQQAVVFLDPESHTVFWMNSTAVRCLREHGAVLSGRRIQLAQRERQKEFEPFVSAATTEAGSWILDLVGESSSLIFRCRTIGETGFRVLTIFHPDHPCTYIPNVGRLFGLTPSEIRILEGLMRGRRADELACELNVSIETVRTHIRRFYNKLGVNSREQMIAVINAYRVP